MKGLGGASFLNNHVLQNGECKNKDKGFNYKCNSRNEMEFQFCAPSAELCPIYDIVSAPPLDGELYDQSSFTN